MGQAMIAADSFSKFVCATLARICNRPIADVTPQTSLLELGLDSLSFVTALAHVEASYDVRVAPHQILLLIDAPTVEELITMLREMSAARV